MRHPFAMAASNVFLCLLLFILHFPDLTRALCYFPDGETVANQDTPCYDDVASSFCCGQGYACMSNGLCKLTDYVVDAGPQAIEYVRGSCSDKYWRSGCPSFCVSDQNGDSMSGAMGLGRCVGDAMDRYFCIDSAVVSMANAVSDTSVLSSMLCTSFRSAVVFQGTPTTVTVIGVQQTSSSSGSASDAPSIAKATTTVFSSPSPTTPHFITQPAMAPDSSSIPIANSTSPRSTTDSNMGIALGASVGMSLGLAAVTIGIYFALRHWRARKREFHQQTDLTDAPMMPYATYTEGNAKEDQSTLVRVFSPASELVEMPWRSESPQELPSHHHDV